MARLGDFGTLLGLQIVCGLIILLLLRTVLRHWWRRRPVRRATWIVLALDVALPVLWFALARSGRNVAADGVIPWLILILVAQVAVIFALALAGLLKAAERLPVPRVPGTQRKLFDPRRRQLLLRGTAAALPVVAVAVCGTGFAEARQTARLKRRVLRLPHLPEPLDGLKILQISDVHLWDLVRLPDLAAALARVPRGEADLVCVTGDLADDLVQLPDALEMIAGLNPPLGCYACLGNHEHSRGLSRVLTIFADGPVMLLRTAGRRLRRDDADLWLTGIDDPRARPLENRSDFYAQQLDGALGPVPDGAFTILMSHRPGGFDQAAARRVDLTLSGHTHGGQAALAGHSILSVASPQKYPWGIYRRGDSLLHVTCGAGQWFPFRFGCPPEIVMLELRRP